MNDDLVPTTCLPTYYCYSDIELYSLLIYIICQVWYPQ